MSLRRSRETMDTSSDEDGAQLCIGKTRRASRTSDGMRALAARSWSSNLIAAWRWMTNPPFLHSSLCPLKNLAPQPSQWMRRWGGVCPTISKMQFISEFYTREASSFDVTWWGLQPLACFLASEHGAIGWCWYWICNALELLFMQTIFGYSDYCFCCYHGLGMLSCLKRLSPFSVDKWDVCKHLSSLGDSALRNWLCLVEPVQNISLQGVVQALASNLCHLSLIQKVLWETLSALPSTVDQNMIQWLVLCVVDTAILVVLSAGKQNMQSVGRHVLHPQAF